VDQGAREIVRERHRQTRTVFHPIPCWKRSESSICQVFRRFGIVDGLGI
jgi:hypothetical protein